MAEFPVGMKTCVYVWSRGRERVPGLWKLRHSGPGCLWPPGQVQKAGNFKSSLLGQVCVEGMGFRRKAGDSQAQFNLIKVWRKT